MKRKKQKKRCPHCKKETVWEGNPYRPFCSERCKMVDLGSWAMENYRIPGETAEEPAKEEKKEEKDVD